MLQVATATRLAQALASLGAPWGRLKVDEHITPNGEPGHGKPT